MNRSSFQKVISLLGVFFIAVTFIGLGIWQWNRAQENRKPIVVDQRVVSLESIAHPRSSLQSKSLLRQVSVTGKYIAKFQAPNQADDKGGIATWEVGLLETSSKASILVVRGLWSDRNQQPISSINFVTVNGTLLPHQSDDHAESAQGVLQRLDSSVIVDQTEDDLYDGYIVASSESIAGALLNRDRIEPPAPRSAVPGFYWQHISYVIIWWFMSGVVLYLPFYQRHQSRVMPSVIPEGIEI